MADNNGSKVNIYPCIVCGHESYVNEQGYYECPVCGHYGWEGESYTGYPDRTLEKSKSKYERQTTMV